jgi:glyoxylase-like metal-dependent hydrolase (beta-lactamase superfamily II)
VSVKINLIREISNNVYLIAEYFSDYTNGYQAFFIASERSIIIDPGPTPFVSKILKSLSKLGFDITTLSYVVPTHIHADHCGGVGTLVQSAPKARIFVHHEGARHLIDPMKMIKANSTHWGRYHKSEIGTILPVPTSQIEVVKGGETIDLGDRILSIIHTPGHSKHHICLHDPDSGELFSGEALGILLPGEEIKIIPAISPPIFEFKSALDSINQLRKLNISKILFSHHGINAHAEACIDIAEKSIRLWGDMVLRALEDGRSRAEIKASLAPYIDKLWRDNGIFSHFLEWAIDGYTNYFIREGIYVPPIK